MNPRERLIATLNHKEPDKMPIDFGVTTVTGIGTVAYEKLLEYLGIEKEKKFETAHIHQGLVQPSEAFYKYYKVDARPVYMKLPPRGTAVKFMQDGSFYDEYNIFWQKGTNDYAPINAPMESYSFSEMENYSWPKPTKDRIDGLKEKAEYLFNNTDFAIVADIMCRGPFESAVKLRGYEQLLTGFYYEPDFVKKLLEKITDNTIEFWDLYLGEISDFAQVVCQGDDLGSQNALIMGPELYRRFIKPCHKQIYDFIHSKTKAKIFMHSCGSIFDIIPDLIEIGVDILNPVQRSARDMEIKNLKKQFGKDICFWGGGIDVQQFLPKSNLDEIEEDVKKTIDIMAPGGGYIFAATHNIHADAAPEKINKIFESALKYR